MQLIGAGLPRTGTLTQKLAFEMLGLGPCYHWVDVLADLNRVEQWERALDGQNPWEEILGGYESTADWPAGFFYAELVDAYPQAINSRRPVRTAVPLELTSRHTSRRACPKPLRHRTVRASRLPDQPSGVAVHV